MAGCALSLRKAPHRIAERDLMHFRQTAPLVLGFVLACILLIGSYYLSWSIAVLPIWVFLLSIYILIYNLRR